MEAPAQRRRQRRTTHPTAGEAGRRRLRETTDKEVPSKARVDSQPRRAGSSAALAARRLGSADAMQHGDGAARRRGAGLTSGELDGLARTTVGRRGKSSWPKGGEATSGFGAMARAARNGSRGSARARSSASRVGRHGVPSVELQRGADAGDEQAWEELRGSPSVASMGR
ncbi:hypothetical protein ZWY2020_041146 [Hordeum vulgare]|nr:hypothetical protein ZWY2020_041146 [Hordeum vulgare]